MQKGFGIVFEPKHVRAFDSEIHHSANGAFNRTRSRAGDFAAKRDHSDNVLRARENILGP